MKKFNIFTIFTVLLICTTAIAATTTSTIQFKRGNEAQLPATAKMGEPLFTRDTRRVFVGYSTGKLELQNASVPTTYTTPGVVTIAASTKALAAILGATFATYNTSYIQIGTGHAVGTEIKIVNQVDTAQLVVFPAGETVLRKSLTDSATYVVTEGGIGYNTATLRYYAVGSVGGVPTAIFNKIDATTWSASSF
jgi:hypothetical protein